MELVRYWVYILHCENDTYYTGYTTDLERRYKEHLLGAGKCKYTRSFKPLGIAQAWEIKGDKSQAMRIEKYIKKMRKDEKARLVSNPGLLEELFGMDT